MQKRSHETLCAHWRFVGEGAEGSFSWLIFILFPGLWLSLTSLIRIRAKRLLSFIDVGEQGWGVHGFSPSPLVVLPIFYPMF